MDKFQLVSGYEPMGDQPQAIEALVKGFREGNQCQTLLGVTGSGKTFTMANVIAQLNKPTLVIAHNKTLAAQLYGELKEFFPNNAVEYFVFITENFVYEKGFLSSDSYDRFTFYVYDNIFYYMTISEMILLMESTPTKKVFHFAADGLSELLAAQINLFTPEEFELWYKFHLHSCCKEEMLGCSNHIVYVAEKI